MLTGKEIKDNNVVTNYLEENIQQVGIDLRLKLIREVSGVGKIPKFGKTQLPECSDWISGDVFELIAGKYYEVIFEEGCDLGDKFTGTPKTRSSVIRCGAEIRSGQFDPGFKTENLGAYLKVEKKIIIERGARLAQFIVEEVNAVENLYDGQYQGK